MLFLGYNAKRSNKFKLISLNKATFRQANIDNIQPLMAFSGAAT